MINVLAILRALRSAGFSQTHAERLAAIMLHRPSDSAHRIAVGDLAEFFESRGVDCARAQRMMRIIAKAEANRHQTLGMIRDGAQVYLRFRGPPPLPGAQGGTARVRGAACDAFWRLLATLSRRLSELRR